MARPKKRTVDYFPHQCNHGKTMFILEQKYGNDGYAFWFKLLELLGSTEGHFLHLENPADWEFLQAKTHLSDSKCQEILDLLARLDAIDQDLWENHRVVWSQNFVNGISDVYRNRRMETPSRPSFYAVKPAPDGVSTPENPQSKLKETKLKDIDDHNNDWVKIASAYTELTGRPESPLDVQDMQEVLKLADADQIIQLMREIHARFRPKYDGDKIKSFGYFRAAIEGELKGGGEIRTDRRHPEKSDAAKRFYSKTLDDI